MAVMEQLKRRNAKRVISNSDIAEFLALEAESADRPILAKAYRRASRSAFLWPQEVGVMIEERIPLTDLSSVGPFIAKKIDQWFHKGTAPKTRPDLRKNFLTLTQARLALAQHPNWKQQYKGDLQCTRFGATVLQQLKKWLKQHLIAATLTSALRIIPKD